MTYKTLLVHLNAGQPNTGLLRIAADLTERFGTNIIGIAASHPTPISYSVDFANAEYFEMDRKRMENDLEANENEFRTAFHSSPAMIEWRSSITLDSVSGYVAAAASSADLVVTYATPQSWLDSGGEANLGDMIMQAGRPVLVVPISAQQLKFEQVMLAWKDTREARRAASDALPLMKMAKRVTIVEIAAQRDHSEATLRLADVTNWLTQHGIAAASVVLYSEDNDPSQLAAFAHKQKADILVAGAYGHSRLREWALGGMTRDLLVKAQCCTLLSH